MIKSFLRGTRLAIGSWKMILLLLLANILFSIPLALLVFVLITQTAGGTLAVQQLYGDKLDPVWLIDMINDQFAGASPATFALQVAGMLVVTGTVYLLINTLLAGGIIEVFASADRRFTMRRFWGGCGGYFWRFFRLMWISMIFYGMAIGVYGLLVWRIGKADSTATVERPTVLKSFAAMLFLLLLISIVNMVFDYARIGAVINDRRKMFRETFKAIRFSLRHPFSAFGLYLILGLSGLTLFAFFLWLRSLVQQDSLGAILLAVVIAQLAIAARMWTRLAYYAGQVDLYQSLVPAPISALPTDAGLSEKSAPQPSQPSESAVEPPAEQGSSKVGA
jgi:hypothetical protein